MTPEKELQQQRNKLAKQIRVRMNAEGFGPADWDPVIERECAKLKLGADPAVAADKAVEKAANPGMFSRLFGK